MTNPIPILTRDQIEDRLHTEFGHSKDLLKTFPDQKIRELLELEIQDQADRDIRDKKLADHKQKMRNLIDQAKKPEELK